MADLTIEVHYENETYHAAFRRDEELDQLLLKSLDHFELDPGSKEDWTLVRLPRERRPEEEPLTLGREPSEELDDGDRVELRPRNLDRVEPTTGSY